MSSPKNIQRDCIFVQPLSSALLGWSTAQAMTTATALMNSDGSTHVDFASAQSTHTATLSMTAGAIQAIGVLMQPPEGDRVPYRIKAHFEEVTLATRSFIMIGYGPASPDGDDDAIDEPVFLPFKEKFDDTVIVETLDSGDGNYGRVLAIGIAAYALSTSTFSLHGHISVQNLSVKPPTMAQAVA